jgi:hypothetical protein
MVMAIGRPARSAMAMILVPLPRLVLPTCSLFFGAGKRAVDEGLAEIQPPAGLEILGERLDDLPEDALVVPALKSAMTRLIRRIPLGKIFPRRAGAENPENPVQDIARIAPRASTPVAAQAGLGQERRENRPLGVSQVHTLRYDGPPKFVSLLQSNL